MNISKWRKAH